MSITAFYADDLYGPCEHVFGDWSESSRGEEVLMRECNFCRATQLAILQDDSFYLVESDYLGGFAELDEFDFEYLGEKAKLTDFDEIESMTNKYKEKRKKILRKLAKHGTKIE